MRNVTSSDRAAVSFSIHHGPKAVTSSERINSVIKLSKSIIDQSQFLYFLKHKFHDIGREQQKESRRKKENKVKGINYWPQVDLLYHQTPGTNILLVWHFINSAILVRTVRAADLSFPLTSQLCSTFKCEVNTFY